MLSIANRTLNFVKHDLWRIPLHTISPKKSFFIKQLRVIILAFRGFNEDKCSLRASALTFYSLLSVVPTAALTFGIAKGFSLENLLEKRLLENMKGQEEAVAMIITFARSMLENTKGGLIAGIGVAVLFWLTVKLLGNIESSFNDIWGLTYSRSLGRKFSDYLSVMMICPVLIILSSGINVFISTKLAMISQQFYFLGALAPLFTLCIKLLPYTFIWFLFTFIYIFIPNTKVRFRYGFIAGITAGTIYQIIQWLYITFQIGVSKYGAIYGSFAALPLFMIWLQLSWLILLLGAEISFACQNVETYEYEPDSKSASNYYRKFLALLIVQVCVKNFCDKTPAMTARGISRYLEVPIRLVNQTLFELVRCRILSETMDHDGDETRYQPAHDTDTLNINSVCYALDNLGYDNLPLPNTKEQNKLDRCLNEFKEILDKSEANLLIKNI